jgi:hypothetical protein
MNVAMKKKKDLGDPGAAAHHNNYSFDEQIFIER